MTDRFGFEVEWVDEPWNDDNQPGWKISLPHQHDAWRIDAVDIYADPTSQDHALARLDAFIAEAQQARAALAAGHEFPPKEAIA
jgi:hypothetical protein